MDNEEEIGHKETPTIWEKEANAIVAERLDTLQEIVGCKENEKQKGQEVKGKGEE